MSLAEFFREGWPVLEPDTPLDWNWHIDAICGHMEAALLDWLAVKKWKQRSRRKGFDLALDPRPVQRIKDQILNVPPGTAKSRIISVATPAWMWTIAPSWKAIFFSGNQDVSTRDSMYCRDLIRSEWYQDTFKPTWKLAKDQDAKTYYRNTGGGERRAISAGARVTGNRADALFFDDINDAAKIESEADRDSKNRWYSQGAGNRINDPLASIRTGIQQRLEEDDWSGHALMMGDWFHLPIPMEFEPDGVGCKCKSCAAGINPVGWKDPRTEDGELMMPDRFTKAFLADELKRLGSAGYAGQYQQMPAAKGGNIFLEAWFGKNRYRALPELVWVATFWDTALKEKEENDESACMTEALGVDGFLYILRAWHGREETPDLGKRLVDQAAGLRQLFGDKYIGDYVEDKVSGTTLMQYLRRSNTGLVLIPIVVEKDKVARAKGVSPICEAGSVRLPDPHIYPSTFEWCRDLLHFITKFPKVKNDDLVDVFVYGCKKFMGTLNAGTKKSRKGKGGGYA